jgi:RNA polymerase sigma-70 factor (ECF subfamily)
VQENSGRGGLIEFPASDVPAAQIALEELDLIYAYIYARVGNRADAEDLTQQVALKAIPRLRAEAAAASIRAYLFATARSVLAGFWAHRFGLPEQELREDMAPPALYQPPGPQAESGAAASRAARILEALPANYRRVLELRFLRGYSLKEVAAETGNTVGGIKVMQLRALRAAAKVEADA